MEKKEDLQTSPQRIADLITDPLIATMAANNKMAKSQSDFMLDTCFTKNELGEYEPVMITMSMTRPRITPGTAENPETTIQSIETKFMVPLLSIIAFNKLAINELTLSFDLEIVGVKEGDDKDLPELYAKISGEKAAGKPIISFNIHTTQVPLPIGVNTLIDAFTKSIEPHTIAS